MIYLFIYCSFNFIVCFNFHLKGLKTQGDSFAETVQIIEKFNRMHSDLNLHL